MFTWHSYESVKYKCAEDIRGVETMCAIWEEVRREGLTEGKTEGRSEDIKNLMQTMETCTRKDTSFPTLLEEKIIYH